MSVSASKLRDDDSSKRHLKTWEDVTRADKADGLLPAFGKEMMECDIVNGNYNDE